MMQLYIANKNYSSWSMRPWLVLKSFNIEFEEKLLPFSEDRYGGEFKKQILGINPSGKVPALVHDGLLVWDSLAICEYLAELFPEKPLWPEDPQQRVRARCISAEMHSGFSALRSLCGMNIRAELSQTGQQLYREHAALRDDIARIEQLWAERPSAQSFLCGNFSIADAFYAPVVSRFQTYGLKLSLSSQQYMHTMLGHPAMKLWLNAALAEEQWVTYLEDYQSR